MTLCQNFPTSIPGGILKIVALGDKLIDQIAMDEFLRLRAKKYLERGYITPDLINLDGTEKKDADDSRSIHICLSIDDVVMGGLRLIVRNGTPLPVEHDFELDEEVPDNSCEVSRFVVNNNALEPSKVSSELIGAAFRATIDNNLVPYIIVEKPFRILMRRLGLKMQRAGPDLLMEHYNNTVNGPFIVDALSTFSADNDSAIRDSARHHLGLWGTIINDNVTEQTGGLIGV